MAAPVYVFGLTVAMLVSGAVPLAVSSGGGKDGVELVELNQSPKFPPRTQPACPPSLSRPSLSRSSTPQRFGSETKSELSSESDSGKSSGSSSKRRLHFKGKDVVNIISRKRTASTSSNDGSDKSPTRPSQASPRFINKMFRIPKLTKQPKEISVDSRVKTGRGHYSVAPRDISVLERISHKAQSRARRIRKPHEVFVELEELRHDPSEGLGWEETARWIKFEEDVEEGSGRWGRPHVSALAFHSLVDLRKGLEKGCIILDVDGEDFPQIAQEITTNLVSSGQLPPEHTDAVLRVLLKKHKHTHDETLWEKVKHSALGPEGRLHHLGEGIRRISHSHRLADLISHGSGGNVYGNHSGSSLKKSSSGEDLLQPKISSDPQFGVEPNPYLSVANRNVSAPTISVTPELQPRPRMTKPQSQDLAHSNKKVVFNIASSDDVLHHQVSDSSFRAYQPTTAASSQNTSVSDVTRATESTFVSQVSIDIESDPGKPNGELKMAEQTDSLDDKLEDDDNGEAIPPVPGILKRNTSVSLMSKIPDEAESLTVLVGGVNFLEEPVVAFVRLAQSHLLGDLTELPIPVRFIFLQLGPSKGEIDYHEVGRAMATLMSDAMFHETAYSAVCQDDIMDAIDNFLEDSIVLPPGDWDQELLVPIMQERNQLRRRKAQQQKVAERKTENPLSHSRRPLGGIWRDLKKLVRRYRSDITDAFSVQVLVSIIFMYIALLGPAIAFGGLMEEITVNAIGESETLLATGLAGIVYGLFAVQPVAVLAFTGPVLLFETIIYRNSINFGLEYIQWRAMIGLWLMLLMIIASLGELSFLVHYFTRFSEEVFTGIVALFFAYEASLTLYHIYERNPLCGINYPCGKYAAKTNTCMSLDNGYNNYTDNDTGSGMMETTVTSLVMENATEAPPSLPRGFLICNQPNTFLWSFILAFGTFAIALGLRKLRKGKFLGKQGRRLVSDFGVLMAIAIMVVVAYLMKPLIAIEVIIVTPNYSTTIPSRGWFINPFDGSVSVEALFGALIPAILVFLLIFIENQLTLIEINKAEHKILKPVGYHWDLLIVGILSGLYGLLGVPFICAASVRSNQYLQSLSVFTKHNAPGEKPKLIKVYEQRVTNIVIHSLIIITPFAYKVLEVIPTSVLLGIFYYLTYASFKGVQLLTRVKLLITPVKHHPKVAFVTKVRTWKMHLYTIIQVLVIALLFGLKLSEGSMVYPLVIVLLIPLKFVLGKFVFTKQEMEALDGEEGDVEDLEEGEFGEYVEATAPY